MTREERDLLVRWVRDLRREPISPELRRRIMRHPEALYRRLQAIAPRTLPSVPSPRAPLSPTTQNLGTSLADAARREAAGECVAGAPLSGGAS